MSAKYYRQAPIKFNNPENSSGASGNQWCIIKNLGESHKF